jgi:phage FluMu protein Com
MAESQLFFDNLTSVCYHTGLITGGVNPALQNKYGVFYFGGYPMEDGTKKIVLIVVIVICFAAAGAITFMTRGGSSANAPAVQAKLWVKCNNPKCDWENQMERAEYNKTALKNGPDYAVRFGVFPIKCPKCGEESVFEAIKCEKCGKVFFPGSVEGKFNDKCPGCGYSKEEEAAEQQPAENK